MPGLPRLPLSPYGRPAAPPPGLPEHPFGVVLAVWATHRWGTDWVGWHPAAVRRECADALGRPLAAAAVDRLLMAGAVAGTDLPWTRARAFCHAANVFTGNPFDPTVVDPPDAFEAAWGAVEMSLIDPPTPADPGFGPEVRRLLAETLRADGFARVPGVLAGACEEFHVDLAAALDDRPDARRAAVLAAAERDDALHAFLKAGVRQVYRQLAELDLPAGARAVARRRLARFDDPAPA